MKFKNKREKEMYDKGRSDQIKETKNYLYYRELLMKGGTAEEVELVSDYEYNH